MGKKKVNLDKLRKLIKNALKGMMKDPDFIPTDKEWEAIKKRLDEMEPTEEILDVDVNFSDN